MPWEGTKARQMICCLGMAAVFASMAIKDKQGEVEYNLRPKSQLVKARRQLFAKWKLAMWAEKATKAPPHLQANLSRHAPTRLHQISLKHLKEALDFPLGLFTTSPSCPPPSMTDMQRRQLRLASHSRIQWKVSCACSTFGKTRETCACLALLDLRGLQ